jgi:phosphoribosyl 1,2-cyclic phosphate phosphodiesterase
MTLKLTLLGTGTSDGVPVVGCNCKVCSSDNPKNKRLRTSAWLHNEDQSISILIDCGPDFREQALKNKIHRLDAILITHTHWDHIAGIDNIRPMATKKGQEIRGNKIDVYILEELKESLMRPFPYIFGQAEQIGGGVPALEIKELMEEQVFYIKGIRFEPLLALHGKMKILGFAFKDTVYLTDVKELPDKTKILIKNKKNLIINALRYKDHTTHLNLEQSLALIGETNSNNAYFVHTTHDLDYDKVNQELPNGAKLGYDGLEIQA